MLKKLCSFKVVILLACITPAIASNLNQDMIQQSQAFESDFEDCPIKRYSIVTSDEVLRHYQDPIYIGAGGEARAYSVKSSTSGKAYALVISSYFTETFLPDHKKDYVERMIENQDKNPHQAKIYGYFWIMNRNYPFNAGFNEKRGVHPFDEVKEGRLLDETYLNDPEATPFRHDTFLLELGLGSCISKEFEQIAMNKIYEKFCEFFCWNSFDRASISLNDHKMRNWIFVETKGQTYCGKNMDSYDYWCYRLDNVCCYFPKPSHFIKRIDFRSGSLRDKKIENSMEDEFVRFIEICKINESDFRTQFCKKPEGPDIRILYINS